MAVPALMFRVMLVELTKETATAAFRTIFWTETNHPKRPPNVEMEKAMTRVLKAIQSGRDAPAKARRERLMRVSVAAKLTNWTDDQGHMKKHVQAMLWKLARVMVQDLWGRPNLGASLYDLLDEDPAAARLDLRRLEEPTAEEVHQREREFLQRGEDMKLFWERSTEQYAHRFTDPLALEKPALHRFVHVTREVQKLMYQYEAGRSWVWSAPAEFWDVCYTRAVLSGVSGRPSRALAQAVIARYDEVEERVAAYHDRVVGGTLQADTGMWLDAKAQAALRVAKWRRELREEAQQEQMREGTGQQRKKRTAKALYPPFNPKRMQLLPPHDERIGVGSSRDDYESRGAAEGVVQQPGVSMPAPSPAYAPVPVEVMCHSDGTPRGAGWYAPMPFGDILDCSPGTDFDLWTGPEVSKPAPQLRLATGWEDALESSRAAREAELWGDSSSEDEPRA